MNQTGTAILPLHGGKAPQWLTRRMEGLAHEIISIMIDEYGTAKFLTRLSDPYWFQALGCVLAYDWHSSGVTTVVTGVLKAALSSERHGVVVCGGKGRVSRRTPAELTFIGTKWGFSQETIDKLLYTSRMTAKVDNSAIQAGYALYHHTFFVTKTGQWAVIEQGLNCEKQSARRYHWLGEKTKTFVEEPHSGIVGDQKCAEALNMVAKQSAATRRVSVDLVKESPKRLRGLIESVCRPKQQTSLQSWLSGASDTWGVAGAVLDMPRHINWDTLSRLYEFQPRNYEELLSVQGVGPATVRGLALVAELVYGEAPCWEDPVRFSFAYGGKDGVPFPVERKAMDESIEILRKAVEEAKIGERDKLRGLKNLRALLPPRTNF
ncbi:MAG: DUF763 domain-containing protein [Nitrososphaerota archaeon]|jgi:hypothetical protein|nr:DUF763 domain-containing protein [Nitrososphaerota archaeon]